MKIAFTGAHSTGKTTLLNRIESQFIDSKIVSIRNITREIIKRGFPLAKDSNVDSFVNYVRDQLRAERMMEGTQFDLLISDRTVLDAFGYASANRSLPRPYMQEYFIEMLEEVARREADYYDLYVYFPVEFPMTPDPVRPDDEMYREAVGNAISDALKTFGVQHLLLTGSVEQRICSLQNAGVLI